MIRVAENLVHTDGNRDIVVEDRTDSVRAYFNTGSVAHLEIGKTYTYSITFRGKKGGYANLSVDGNAPGTKLMVEHTGEVQTIHFPVIRANNVSRGVLLVAQGYDTNYVAGESIRFISCSVHEGEQGSDVYVPHHSTMTPEQIALMKYGEYKEIKSF